MLGQTASIPITVGGQTYQVVIRPLRQEHLAKLGAEAAPSVFAGEEGRGEQNPAAAIEFLRLILVAGVVRIDGPGGPYRLGFHADYERRILEPEDLEEPGLSKTEPYKNCQTIFREILILSGMENLFRPAGGEESTEGAGAENGPAAAPASG